MESTSVLVVILIAQALICSGLSGTLAEKKGYSTGAWFAAGFFLGIFGLIAAAGLPVLARQSQSDPLTKPCPDCAEPIRQEALVCKHCARRFDKKDILASILSSLEDKSIHGKLRALDSLQTYKDEVVFTAILNTFDQAGSTANYLGDPSVAVMNKAAHLLSNFRDMPVTKELLALFKKGGNTIKLVKIIETLGMLKDPAAIPCLVQALDNSNLRIAATSALHRFGSSGIPSLELAIKDAKGVSRRLAQKILEQLSKMP